jgi:hypothetical protein
LFPVSDDFGLTLVTRITICSEIVCRQGCDQPSHCQRIAVDFFTMRWRRLLRFFQLAKLDRIADFLLYIIFVEIIININIGEVRRSTIVLVCANGIFMRIDTRFSCRFEPHVVGCDSILHPEVLGRVWRTLVFEILFGGFRKSFHFVNDGRQS